MSVHCGPVVRWSSLAALFAAVNSSAAAAKEVVRLTAEERNFQQGIALEGTRRHYEISRNPEAIDYLKRWAAIFQETKTLQHNAAQAFGFLYSKTGDKQYLDLALACIRRNAGDMRFNRNG